jgi:hypothetical protein
MYFNYISVSLLLIIFASAANAQQKINYSLQNTGDASSEVWSFEANAYYYIMPNDKNTTTLIATADHSALHLEGRYNYEDEKTFSMFGGYNFETGKEFVLGLTPMLGFAVGNIDGIIPGLELSLSWKILDYYSESEYVFDLEGKENDYFYTWAELGITPFDNFRAGLLLHVPY